MLSRDFWRAFRRGTARPPSGPRARIAHVLPFSDIGGTELQTLRIAQTARDLGFESAIYAPEGAAAVQDLFASQGFAVERYPQVPLRLREPGRYWQAARSLAARFRARGTDIVHCADILGAHFAAPAGRVAGARVLCHVRNPYPKVFPLERPPLGAVQQFVFVSEDVRKRLAVAEFRKTGPVIYGVPSALQLAPRDRAEARRRFGLPEDAFVFGTAARLAAQKDYETLVRAGPALLRAVPHARVLIAAELDRTPLQREQYQRLQPLLDSGGARRAFVFAGFQSDMSWFYAAIDAFVLSTHFEGLGTVLQEAMHLRKPIAATAVCGVTEALVDGKTGLLAPHQDAEALARQLARLALEPALRESLAAAAADHSERAYGLDRYRRQIDALYSGAAEGL